MITPVRGIKLGVQNKSTVKTAVGIAQTRTNGLNLL